MSARQSSRARSTTRLSTVSWSSDVVTDLATSATISASSNRSLISRASARFSSASPTWAATPATRPSSASGNARPGFHHTRKRPPPTSWPAAVGAKSAECSGSARTAGNQASSLAASDVHAGERVRHARSSLGLLATIMGVRRNQSRRFSGTW